MAHQVLTMGFFSWNSTDLSDHCRSINLTYEAEAVDDTNMGDTTEVNLGGVKRWQIDIEAASDEASSELNATMFADVGVTRTVIVRPHATSVSATNPNYTGTGLLTSFTPISGSHGELSMAPITIRSAGALSRATS